MKIRNYENFLFESILPEKIFSLNEKTTMKNYLSVEFNTEKICNIYPKMEEVIGLKIKQKYNKLTLVIGKDLEQEAKMFSEHIKTLTDNLSEVVSKAGSRITFVFSEEKNFYLFPTNSEVPDDVINQNVKIESFEQYENYKIQDINILNDKVSIVLFNKKYDKIQNIVLLDISQIFSDFKAEKTDTPKVKRTRHIKGYITKEQMDKCGNEMDVQGKYSATLALYDFELQPSIAGIMTDGLYSFNVDGKECQILAEFKYDIDMSSNLEKTQIIMQCLLYLKRFEVKGLPIPEIILIGDRNECALFTYDYVSKYLNDKEVDWTAGGSNFHIKNPNLLTKLLSEEFKPFPFNIDDDFNFSDVVNKIKELAKDSKSKTKITAGNISTAFHSFISKVLHKDVKLSANEKVNLFIQILINSDDNYLHPSKPEIVSKSFGAVKIDRKQYQSLMSHYDGFHYTNEEKDKLVGVSDMIILEEDRRKQGEYFTPDILTLKADEYLSRYLGGDYKDKFYVWDCAAGMGNLTRNFKYAHLFQSTLHKSDTQTMEQSGINPEATKFQFDFLNDELGKLPSELMEAIKSNKPILFYINPPYMRAGDIGATVKNLQDIITKKGESDTKISDEMKNDNWGGSSSNLYSQFLYRIWRMKKERNLTNLYLGVFCPELFLSGGSYKKFREKFLVDFEYLNAFLTPASMFSDVANNWGILFSVWKSGKNVNNTEFNVDVFDKSLSDDTELTVLKDKSLYNLDNEIEASKWVREKTKELKTTKNVPQLTSALNIKNGGYGSIPENYIGYLFNKSNQVMTNSQQVAIFSVPYAYANGVPIIKENIFEISTLFTSRRLISGSYDTWINHMSEYLAPNEKHPQWEQFKYDSIVYSLFDSKSQQSSLRDIDYKSKIWNIQNEFFWIPVDKMSEAIKQSSYTELYNDIKTFGKQRYVASLLYDQGIYNKLSEDAKFVLDRATAIVIKSIPQRKIAQEENSKLCAYAWDAGWYQIKAIIDTVKLDSGLIKDFSTVYKEFGDRLRPLIYELGFLK
jgi:hypothetical protein